MQVKLHKIEVIPSNNFGLYLSENYPANIPEIEYVIANAAPDKRP